MTIASKARWIQAGLNQLREQGFQAISGEKLARRLDVTRGSFYHHFKNMDDYVEQLMTEWEQTHTLQKISQAQHENPWQEMMQLLELAWDADVALEIAVRQWSFIHPLVQQRVEKVDQLRLHHMTTLYGTLTNDPTKGQKLGIIAYYGLLGALHASPRPSKTALKALILEIQTLLISGPWSLPSAKLL